MRAAESRREALDALRYMAQPDLTSAEGFGYAWRTLSIIAGGQRLAAAARNGAAEAGTRSGLRGPGGAIVSRASELPGLAELDPSQVPTEREAFEWLRGLAMEGDMRAAMALFAWADAVDEARGVPGMEIEVIDFGGAP